jgi:hypothetical protein
MEYTACMIGGEVIQRVFIVFESYIGASRVALLSSIEHKLSIFLFKAIDHRCTTLVFDPIAVQIGVARCINVLGARVQEGERISRHSYPADEPWHVAQIPAARQH